METLSKVRQRNVLCDKNFFKLALKKIIGFKLLKRFRSIQITVKRLVLTIVLGVVFLRVQWVEFSISSLTMARRFYRSILFSSLRFHRMHVLVRVLFSIYALRRVLSRNSTPESHPVYLCSVIY